MNGISALSTPSSSAYGSATSAGSAKSIAHTTAADPATETPSALCSFSAESLERLGAATEAGMDAIGELAHEAGEALAESWDSATATAADWAADLSDLAQDGWDTLAQAVDAVGDSIADTAYYAADAAGDAVEHSVQALDTVADALGTGAKNAASYLAMGWSAAQATLHELA